MLHHAPSVIAVEAAPDLICSLCLDTWKKPVELRPCGHIFCEACIGSLDLCPECRGSIKERVSPNRVLCNLASQVHVQCDGCGWTGRRHESFQHRCFSAPHPNLKRSAKPVHDMNPAVEEQLNAYFMAFGAVHKQDALLLQEEGFLQLVRCFNYAESVDDMERIFHVVHQMSEGIAAERGGRVAPDEVSVAGLCLFLSRYPADSTRLYKLSLGQYHECMYQLWQWFNGSANSMRKFNKDQFLDFSVRFSYIKKPKTEEERVMAIKHWMPLVDVCDADDSISQHEMLRFMSSCLRGTSLNDENIAEGLVKSGTEGTAVTKLKQEASEKTHKARSSHCCTTM